MSNVKMLINKIASCGGAFFAKKRRAIRAPSWGDEQNQAALLDEDG